MKNCKTCDFNKVEKGMFIKDFCTIMECQVTPKFYNFCKYYKSKQSRDKGIESVIANLK